MLTLKRILEVWEQFPTDITIKRLPGGEYRIEVEICQWAKINPTESYPGGKYTIPKL